jgi:hypothetical protein
MKKIKKIYQTPKEHFFRLHHVRPRFKSDVERVLLLVSTLIAGIPAQDKDSFDKIVNESIKKIPGNVTRSQKTINNWRTEISSLFGLILYDPETEKKFSSEIAKKMAKNQDLVEFFKIFCYLFQYPGGHLKAQENKKVIENKIKFKPVRYILKLLYEASKRGETFGLNKAEATHCIFNDLRVTAEDREVIETVELIEENRKNGFDYVWSGDVVRYAGDILDYMYYANLLKKYGNNYYLNTSEMSSIAFFIKEDDWFGEFDEFYNKNFQTSDLRNAQIHWFHYISGQSLKLKFETDVLAFLGIDKQVYMKLEKQTALVAINEFKSRLRDSLLKTKEIGDAGESLAQGHECMRLKNAGRDDLIDKVIYLPNHLKMGYDLRSFEIDSTLRHIEVKTTVSNSDIDFRSFHMTENEWNVAKTLGDTYFVYRLAVNRTSVKLFIIQNPVNKYKEGLLDATLSKGMQVGFGSKSGGYEKLLIWKE